MVLGFLELIFLGSLLLSLPAATTGSVDVSYLDALFTATSAVCVTGLVVVDTGTAFSAFGQGVILTLIQIGGLGFMTLSTTLFLMAGKKIGLRDRLLIREAFSQYDLSGLVKLVRQVVKTTLFCEGIGALLLTVGFLAFMPFRNALYYGIFHAISAFCNAGFDLFGKVSGPFSSLTAYAGEWFTLVIAFLIIIGGLGFPVLMDLGKRLSGKKLSLHSKMGLLATATLLVCGFFAFFSLEHNNPGTLGEKPLSAQIVSTFFQTVTPRTAGFNSLPLTALSDPTVFLLIILMFIGASPSSTGGGIKTTTFFTLILAVWAMIRGKRDVELFERRLPTDVILKAFTIAFISSALVGVVTFCLSCLEPEFSFLALFFEATSAFSTAGLSQGVTPNLTSPFSKMLLIGTMFAGRVGLFTIVVALTHQWQTNIAIRYSEERIIIG
ncbi:MAG TPA: Trk family potassium uptake protein [Firmicutes bacterium]|nr:Trk family potassium uptake protein [Bacillota bacterium]